jgi:hypothetical protein
MMIIKKLTWLSKDAKEAELLISDGHYECVAYSCPCKMKEGEILYEPLHAFMVKDLMVSFQNHCSISLLQLNRLSHHCVAEVVDSENGIVRVGKIKIDLDERIPITQGDLVEFNCLRLDVW